MRRRHQITDILIRIVMIASLAIVMLALVGVIAVVLWNGAPALSLDMVTKTPSGGYYLGGGGGILNAIVGSLYLGIAATILAFFLSVGVATYLQKDFIHPRMAGFIRNVLELLWGIPSIVYGVFCFVIMVFLGMGTSLLAGIIALTLLEIPIMTRTMDESISQVPTELKLSAYVLGSNRTETSVRVVWRQALPGILSGILLAFGRGIGDAASILFTAGFTDTIPTSLGDSAAALPTMIFFLSTSPLPEVRERAYAAAFILLTIVLLISVVSRLLSARFSKHIIK
jgi:phosphate transport system permease protein